MTHARRAGPLLALAAAVALPACRSTFVRRAGVSDHPAVVSLIVASGIVRHHVGTGFFVAPGVLVTAHHVVRAAAFVGGPTLPVLLAQSEDGTRRRVVAVRGDAPARDVVALSVEDAKGLSTLPLQPALPGVGSAVVVVGYTTSLRIEAGHVVTDASRGDPAWETSFVATCNVSHGHSGSPVLDAQGDVVGVAIRGGDGRVKAQGAAEVTSLVGGPERRWDMWCSAERDDASERAAKEVDLGQIARSRDAPSAVRSFRRAAELAEDDFVLEEAVEGQCECLARDDGPEEAAALARARLKASPRCAWAERLLGTYLLSGGDSSGYEHLATASVLDPTDPGPVLDAAEWSLRVAPAPDLAPALRRAVEQQPHRVRGWELLGRLASKRGDFEEAARAWERALDLRPDHAAGFTEWAFALTALGRHDEAREAVEAALRIDPKNRRARYALVVVLLAVPDRDGARRAFVRLRADDPEYARPLEPFVDAAVPAGR